MDALTQQEINKIAAKVLREIGVKEPPVEVEDVLAHLNLYRD